MTTGGSGTGSAREDELLARLYDQLTELLTARFGADYQAAAGLDRFGAWLGEHAAAGETGLAAVQAGSPAAAQASPGARNAAAIPSGGPARPCSRAGSCTELATLRARRRKPGLTRTRIAA